MDKTRTLRALHRLRSPPLIVSAALGAAMACGCSHQQPRSGGPPAVIAHRGASGYLPEHTLEAYSAAYFMGADAIEPDVVLTRDSVAICHHDITIDRTTNAESVYPDRARADGRWYAIDFTLAELRALEVDGPESDFRGATIPTFEEMLALVARLNTKTGGRTRVVPEIKKPAFHESEGRDAVRTVAGVIRASGIAPELVLVQCFDAAALERAGAALGSAYQLLLCVGDEPIDDAQLAAYATRFDAIGPPYKLLDTDPTLAGRAQDAGLDVYPYTYLADERPYRDAARVHRVDGVFSNYPDVARRVFDSSTEH